MKPLSPTQVRVMLAMGRGEPAPQETAATVDLRARGLLSFALPRCDNWLVITELGRAWLAGFAAGQEWESE